MVLEIVVDDMSDATSLTEVNWLTEEEENAAARIEEVLEMDAELISPPTVAN